MSSTSGGTRAGESGAATHSTHSQCIEFRGLEIGYGRERVAGPLHDVWHHGSLIALTGPNGAGKTTLLRTLLGFLRPLAGEMARLDRVRVGYVPQLTRFEDGFPVTVDEVLGTARAAAGRPTSERRDRALIEVDMAAQRHRKFFELSGGQRQRVLLARALVGDADLIALDEPTAGVDGESAEAIWKLLRRTVDGGRSVVVVTHDLHRLPEYADRILVLDRGVMREEERYLEGRTAAGDEASA